ncbi:MAG TPA: lysophospholipid acyltransferase family protein [Pusillimonas sp.]|uniref:lysophospholipid acyltransferase family protein n=1 Tax=Pusillimonas sp. TaxID=3040095 RepID=UPI002C4E1335|nr:lysophospholipid acyltransferase family protein [Pusillimonas sp.]HUH87893.1 lysophospholipid acyltransferase family protein [Pusillimonas sp.]
MKLYKTRVLTSVFSYFGRCATRTRLRWGRALGWLAPRILGSRAHIVRTNLKLCFPQHSEQQREAWLRTHFQLLAQSVVDRGLLWFGTRERIEATISIEGLQHLQALLDAKRPIILLAPHFIGLDAAATRLTLFLETSATLYTPQSDPYVDQLVREGRGRFNTVHLISRRDGVRGLIRQLRKGVPVYYLPDMDWGTEGAAFVPFFGVPAATLLTTAQIAKTWEAAVVPIVSRLDIDTGHYHVDVLPPIADFPGEQSLEDATARLNRLLETWVERDPTQYYWVHRRFKTRPPGEERPY